jgi:hypothetical protein
MKKNTLYFLLFSILLVSCSSKLTKLTRQYQKEARIDKYDCFIQKNDGTVIEFSTADKKNIKLGKDYFIINGITIYFSDIKSYQSKEVYSERVYQHTTNMKSISFSQMFADRIIDGKIEFFILYETHEVTDYNSQRRSFEHKPLYMLRKKSEQDNVRVYSKDLLTQMVADNAEVKKMLKNTSAFTNTRMAIMNIVKAYNNQ